MPSWFHRTLEQGASGPDVELVQRRLRMHPTAIYDQETEARVRSVQLSAGLRPTGVVDRDTAEAIGESERCGLVPDWYGRRLDGGEEGPDVEHLRWLLGLPRAGVYDSEVDAAVRRFQSAHHLTPTGTVDETVAALLGEDVPLNTA